jgi:enoyl-CoA hydratase/carnithine racemase
VGWTCLPPAGHWCEASDGEPMTVDLTGELPGLIYKRDDHIAYITINRPDRANSLHASMVEPMKAIWAEVRDDPWIRCAVLTATGDRFFCTGADVGAVAARGRVSSGRGPLSEEVFWSPRQNRVWKPTVTAVNGTVAGAGLHFVVDADIIVAAEHALFLDTHVNVGMVGAIENIGLAKRLPLGSALRMTLCGRSYRMPASRAYELGLVDELVAADKLLDTADEIAHQIAANSPAAVQLSMQAIWSSLEMGYTHAQEYGWALLRMHWDHPDFKEGPRAFAEKREPNWYDPTDET